MIQLKTILLEVITSDFIDKMKFWENSVRKGWDADKEKWFPHRSLEGGLPTIAYGHKLSSNTQYKTGISDSEAVKLLRDDISKAINKIKNTLHISNFDSLPLYIQQSLVNATFRGELKSTHRTVEHIRNNNWNKVASEYLDNNEYRTTNDSGIRKRMEWNARQFEKYAAALKFSSSRMKIDKDNVKVYPIPVATGQEVTIILDRSILPIDEIQLEIFGIAGKLIKKHRWNSVKLGKLQFPAPETPGVYTGLLNRSAFLQIYVR